ncbi:MAG: efflux RND transporter periplasmic adaptor subunit [Bacteroidetes bacterium]|nr:efflux RND transporter periplasmic adaptor subunit [Bacteroidota bacterium]
MNPIKNKFSPASLIILAVCITVISGGCASSSSEEVKEQKPATEVGVEVVTLQKVKMASTIELPGELIAFQQVDLYAKVNSFVKKLNVDVGSEVKAGQLLAVMEAPEVNAQLDAAASRLKSQEAVYLASKSNYDRLYETSQTPGTVSQNDIDQALAKKNSDEAQLEAAKSAYKEIVDTKNYLEISAPFDGVISARNVNAGAYVGPSGKGSELPLFTLQQQKKLRLVVSIPELYTGYLHDKLNIEFGTRAIPQKKFTATVSRLAGALDNKLRAERVEMDVINNDKKLLPGMVVEVKLPLPAIDSSFVVPKTAVVSSTERLFVIKISDQKAQWIDIKKGREEGNRVEIYGDLKTGDSLAKRGSEEIRNGSFVKKITTAKQ